MSSLSLCAFISGFFFSSFHFISSLFFKFYVYLCANPLGYERPYVCVLGSVQELGRIVGGM